MRARTHSRPFLACIALCLAPLAHADEGMWLPNHPPLAQLKSAHGFVPTDEWLDHMQKSAVRISTGGSGSLVSKDGLVMTNHHVGSETLAKLSTGDRNLLRDGFAAPTRAEELVCPEIEMEILWSVEDVTRRVNDAAKGAPDDAAAAAARRRAISEIEAESKAATGLTSEVVTLYQGGMFHLYRYRTFQDIRLVFAPEEAIAFFGGDTDNFEFPRYDLDCCFFRIYEDGKPLRAERFLSWSPNGAAAGDLVFVWGHPGRTQRQFTSDQLAYLRDVEIPLRLAALWRAEVKLRGFMARSPENERVAREAYFGAQNSRKAYTGLLDGLQDPRIIDGKRREEAALRTRVAADPQAAARFDDAMRTVADSVRLQREIAERHQLLERGWRGSDLFRIARHIVRLANELPKPSGERLSDYRDAALDSLYLELYSPAPIHDELEVEMLANQLGRLAERLGGDDPTVVRLLDGTSPRERARALVTSTSIRPVDARRALVEGGASAISSSGDPLLAFALAVDEAALPVRRQLEDEVDAPQRRAHAELAAARFATEGDSVFPDATGTLRIAFGTVRGYEEDGRQVPPFTTVDGLYSRADERRGQEWFSLPQRWLDRKAAIASDTPFNFVCDADIIGGNSGSPVVNAEGQVVGLIFDGNIHSLVGDVVFDGTRNRAVAVDSRAIIEALRKVYSAGWLADEITSGDAS